MSTLLRTTRSNKSKDAHRDFDGFDADEERRRMRMAFRISVNAKVSTAARSKAMRAVVEMAVNLDEYLTRGGALPWAWMGADGTSRRWYSGKDSERFWHMVNSSPAAKKRLSYSLGCALQTLEEAVLRLLRREWRPAKRR